MNSRSLLVLALGLTISGSAWAQSWSTVLTAPATETFDAATPTASPNPSCNDIDPGVLPAGWTLNQAEGSASWLVNNGPTASFTTGPNGDRTSGSGNYVYAEASCGQPSLVAILESPCYDVSALPTAPNLDFWFHMRGLSIGRFSLESWDGQAWREMWSRDGAQGNDWVNAQAGLYTFDNAGTPSAAFRFKVVHNPTGSNSGDIGLDDITIQDGPLRPEWQENRPEMSLDLDGVTARIAQPAIVNNTIFACPTPVYPSSLLTITSTLPGAAWDLFIAPGAAVGGLGGGLDLGNETFVNIDIFNPLTSTLGNGSPLVLPPLLPGATEAELLFPFTLQANVQLALQAVVVDASLPTGFSLSQASELNVTTQNPPTSLPGPTGDNERLTYDVAQAPVCWIPGGVPFFGTLYDSISINANGHIGFNGGAGSQFSSPAGAASGPARIGLWTDLDPSEGGAITMTRPSPTVIRVDWTMVPYDGAGPANSFAIEVDAATGIITFSGLQGILGNPGTDAADAQWLGLSPGFQVTSPQLTGDLGGGAPGVPANDPGPANFGVGQSGAATTATDMLYQYNDPATSQTGLLPSIQAGLDVLIFTPDGNGNYTWMGL